MVVTVKGRIFPRRQKTFLEGRKQCITIRGCKSSKTIAKYVVPQWSVLGPLLFILFIIDLNQTLEFSSVHHFADDTNLLLIESSLKKINKFVNRKLKLAIDFD